MSLKVKDVERAWSKLKMKTKNSNDRFAKLYVANKLILITGRSWGSGKLDGTIQHKIRQQMHLDEDQFRLLIACPLGREQYLEILHGKGYL